ncbi:MAG: hypothetical protein GKR97_02550 [Rhizobiaceae bacterium]|nr:hypothetical protein [Rhizobiaceae bacterium]
MRIEDEKFLAALVLALGVVVAFQFEGFASGFTGFLMPSLFCVMVFSLLPYVNYENQIFTKLHPAVLPLVGLQQLLLPGLVATTGWIFKLDSQIVYFIMVTLTSGSLFASPTLVHLMGLDQKLAVQTVVVSTLVAPISIFVGFSLLHDGHFQFDFVNFAIRLFALMIVPLGIFLLIRQWARNWTPKSRERSIQIGRWGSVLSLVIFCFALEAPVVVALQTDSQRVLFYIAVSIMTTISVALVLRVAMAHLGYNIAMTASVLASFRNIGLTFGLVGYANDSNLAVYVGASQIPMFFAPLLFELVFGRNVRLYKDADSTHALDPEADYVEDPGSDVNPTGTGPAGPAISTSARAVISSTGVAVSSGMAVGGSTMSAQAAEVQEQYEQPQFETQADVASEDARELLNRLEGHYDEDAKADTQEGRAGGRFVIATLALFIMGIAAIWQGNKYFAPMLFDQNMISDVTQAHTDGRNYGVFDLNINIRDLRNETIKRMTTTPDVGVLGASHWQEAHVSLLSGVNVYNSHVHRDYYEDMMAMVEIYERHGRLPPELIITIRDKLLTPVKDRTDFLWLPGIKYYRRFAERTGFKAHSMLETLPVQTWRELANFSLLKTHGTRHLTAPVMPHATDERNFEGLDTLLPGGSILWSGEHKRLFSQERARNEALSFAEASKNSPPKIDPKGVAHMEFLFEYLKDKGVKVTLAHPQFNPIFWDAVQGTEYMVGLKKIQDLTKDWAAKYGFGLVGGFSPQDVGCRAKQYIDAEHGNPACLGMLLMQYRLQSDEFKLRGAL